MFVFCQFVCKQDNSKTYLHISVAFSRSVGHAIREKWSDFGGDPNPNADPGFFFKGFVNIAR